MIPIFDAWPASLNTEVAVGQASLVVLVPLVPIAILAIALRQYAAIREFGTTHVTSAEHRLLTSKRPVLRAILGTAMALALMFGGLAIERGLMAFF